MSFSKATPKADISTGQTATPSFIARQADGQLLARVFLGASVKNADGQTVGDINDLVFDHMGQISSAVLGVGGFLAMGEKTVAIPFSALKIDVSSDGARRIVVSLGKNELMHAPTFEATEKTTFDNVRDIAAGLGSKASEAVTGLKEKAVRKIGEMNTDTPKPL